MIKKLRARFIRIAMASVAVVLLLLTAILNTANYITNDHDLTRTLALIADNRGTIPDIMPGTPPVMPASILAAFSVLPTELRRCAPPK